MLKGFIGLLTVFVIILTPTAVILAGTLIEDFEDGDAEGWERSPQNEDSKVFWGVKDGAMMFDPKGLAWNVTISQMNFVGTSRVSNVRDWTDYDVEVDIKFAELANYPGGVRGRVDLDTGGHYVGCIPVQEKSNCIKTRAGTSTPASRQWARGNLLPK